MIMGLSFEGIAIILLSFTTGTFGILYFRSLLKLKQVVKLSADLIITNQILEQSHKNSYSEEITDVHKENFIKFLSDSRDWAFGYIENVQDRLKEFIDLAEKEFAYFDKYGILIEGHPHYETLKTMSAECKKLKDLLPEGIDDRR